MPRKRRKPEEIVTKLRQVDVMVSQGQGIVDAIRQIGVSEVACVTNCSTAKSSSRCGKLRSSSKVGAVTTTPSARMPRSAKTLADMEATKSQISIYGLHVALPDDMKDFPVDLVPLP
jgi:hypothetical protein